MKPDAPRLPASVKVVRRRLADGTVKEYRYDRDAPKAKPVSAIEDMSRQYQQSPEFRELSPKWQLVCSRRLEQVAATLRPFVYSDFNQRWIRSEFYALRDTMQGKPAAADQTMKVLARLLEWAYDRGIIEYNHAQRIGRLKPHASRAEILWTAGQREAFLKHAGHDLAAAFTIAFYTAMRISDLVAVKWSDFDGNWLVVKTSKTGAIVHLPVYMLAPLRETIDGLSRCCDHMLSTEHAHPWSVINLSKRFQRCYAAAGLSGLHWHDLRGTAATELANAGATELEVKAIIGHSFGGSSAFGSYVTRSRELAQNAYRKWNAALRPAEDNVIPFAGKR